MFLKSIELVNFRNIKKCSLEFEARLNIFLGKNGQGKTSLLEAINYLSCAKSFRTNTKTDLILTGSEQAVLRASLLSSENKSKTDLSASINAGGKTQFLKHGKKVSFSKEYLGSFTAVSFCPSDTEIIRGEPALRRKFLDKHITDIYPAFIDILIRFNKAIKSKLAVLCSGRADNSSLDPWDRIISETTAKICAKRKEFLHDLEYYSAAVLPLVAANDGQLSFNYKSASLINDRTLNENEIFTLISEQREKEIFSQRALIGAHRDDFLINLNGLKAREFSSQGQAKTLTLLMKLAVIELIEAKTGEHPLILLDDVDSELDQQRAEFLFTAFSEKPRQIFISSTNQQDLWPKSAGIFKIENGNIIS